MKKGITEKYREQGRQEQLQLMISKFEELHNEYYGQGDLKAADLVTDLVAYIQDDFDGMSDVK